MSSIVNNRKRKHSQMSDVNGDAPTPFLSLPNEILTKIFEMLSPEDRDVLASINDRLSGIEKKAGYRRFTSVVFSSGPSIDVESEFEKENLCSDSLQNTAAFFNRATTSQLEIEGQLDGKDEQMLQVMLKNMHFEILWANFKSENACRIIRELLKGRTSVEEVAIYWDDIDKEIDIAKNLLVELPPMAKCNISVIQSSPLVINDVIFLHIIANTSRCAYIDCEQSTITSNGLASAFEMVCNSHSRKEVHCFIPCHEVDQWIQGLETSKFVVSPIRISHSESGSVHSYAYVYCYPNLYSVHMNHSD